MKLKHIIETGERREDSAYGNNYIYNPSIMDVEPGNMIRVSGKAKHPNFEPYEGQKNWGAMVKDVDYKGGRVLVGEYMGGSKTFNEWVPIDQVEVTWNVGGYEKATRLMRSLGIHMIRNMEKRQEIEDDAYDDSVRDKHIQFKR